MPIGSENGKQTEFSVTLSPLLAVSRPTSYKSYHGPPSCSPPRRPSQRKHPDRLHSRERVRDHTVDAFAVVVPNLGFKPALLKQGGKQGRFSPVVRQGCRIGRVPCPLAAGDYRPGFGTTNAWPRTCLADLTEPLPTAPK